jgi:hypothetical protein
MIRTGPRFPEMERERRRPRDYRRPVRPPGEFAAPEKRSS